ncbi:putative reverse transcriptase domain-containing protein [Tanacetum coccineum]
MKTMDLTTKQPDEDEREPMFVQAHDPHYVPEPIYPEYIPFEDEHEFLAEEQPLPPVDSPTAESPGYVTESDPKDDPEEYEDDETKDSPVDYPMDGGDDGDDDDENLSRDDADDEDEEEEEEHLAPAESAVVVPADEHASISLPPEAEVERLLAMTTPSPSPPISLSPPSAGERLVRCMAPPAHSSPPPVPSPLLPSSGCPTQIQTLRIASTQAFIDAVTAALPSPPLPPLPPSLYIPPPVDRRDDIPKSEQPPRKRLCLSTLGSRYEIGESSTARPTRGRGVDYRDTWVDPTEAVPDIAPMTVGEVNTRVTELAELHEHDTQDFYALLEDAQDSRSRISQRVDMNSQRVDLLMGDKMTLQETVCMVEEEGTEGVVGLTWWIEKMESVFNISGCAIGRNASQVSHLRPLLGAALDFGGMVKGNDVPAYTERFQELTLICTKFVANETEKVDKYISGLPDNIYGNVKSARPKTLDETIELANDLMDQKLRTYAERQFDNKRKADDSSRNNHSHQQQPFKRQNVAKVYNMGTGERKPYGGSLPKCTKCHLHHNGPCTQKCHKCNKVGHFARDCRSTGNTNVANTQKGNGAAPKGNGCFECGAPGHFKRDCPKLKNKDGGNGNAQGWVYAVGNAEKRGNASGNPDANVVTGTFLLNNHYASILFDTGADRSFISTTFSSLINIAPTLLENCYDFK